MQIKSPTKIVAFVDVLGFKELISKKDVESIEKYFTYVGEQLKIGFKSYEIDFFLISDALVIYSKYDEAHLVALIDKIAHLQARLLTIKILVRGSISFGDLYVDKSKNIIVGQGLVNAYLLEQRAYYPRVILDREFLKESTFRTILRNSPTKCLLNLSEFDSKGTGFMYVDYAQVVSKFKQFQQNNRLNIICDFIEENIYSNQFFEKYNWVLKELLNALHTSSEQLEKKIPKARHVRIAKKQLRLQTEALQRLQKL